MRRRPSQKRVLAGWSPHPHGLPGNRPAGLARLLPEPLASGAPGLLVFGAAVRRPDEEGVGVSGDGRGAAVSPELASGCLASSRIPVPGASLVARAEAPVLFINFNLRNVVGDSPIKM